MAKESDYNPRKLHPAWISMKVVLHSQCDLKKYKQDRKINNMTKKISYKTPASRLSSAYESLYKLQEKRGRYLSYEEATKTLLSAPGFTFDEGKTAKDLLKDLERYHLISLDSIAERVFVISQDEKNPQYIPISEMPSWFQETLAVCQETRASLLAFQKELSQRESDISKIFEKKPVSTNTNLQNDSQESRFL